LLTPGGYVLGSEQNQVNLYRIITDVRAGSHQRSVANGDSGIVTVWVSAESEGIALVRAKLILTNRRYASIGRLQSCAQTLAHDSLACATQEQRAADRREDFVLAGYDAMRDHAFAQADGLHEVWLAAPLQQAVRQKKSA
jgi:hypothetical protein